MSRSYKKTPFCGQTQRPADKRIVNHKVRQKLKNHLDWNIQYNNYKKISESWMIRDWGWIYNWEDWRDREIEEYIRAVHRLGEEKAREWDYTDDLEVLYRDWYKRYKMK